MNSRVAGMAGVLIVILVAGSGVLQAGTTTITFSQKGIVTVSNVFFVTGGKPAALYTFTGIDSTGHSFSGQMVIDSAVNGSANCTFTGPGGIPETGHVYTLTGGAAVTIIPGVGRLYSVATSGIGCSNRTAISFTEQETIEGGGGSYNGATGTRTLQTLQLFAGQSNEGTSFIKVTGSATITVP